MALAYNAKIFLVFAGVSHCRPCCVGRAVTTPRLSMEEILEGDRLRVERRHKKALQWFAKLVPAPTSDKLMQNNSRCLQILVLAV